jgi:uncharacterized protein (TIGR02466 family)
VCGCSTGKSTSVGFWPEVRAVTMSKRMPAQVEKFDVLRLFPTFVWRAELRPEVCLSINDLVLSRLNEIEPLLRDLQAGESWQSDHGLHLLEGFEGLVGCIVEAGESLLDCLKVVPRSFQITGCWATVNGPGASHRVHSHPNNYLSGVYYVQTQEGANTINFHDPRHQVGILCPPVSELTAETTDQVVVRVKDGTLLMFPAWLQHSVDPNRSDRARVSISFNIMLSAYAETISKPMWKGGWRRPLRPR